MTGKRLGASSREMLTEICGGIACYCLTGELIILFLPVKVLPAVLAFFLGCVLSACSMTHIAYVTEFVLDMHSSSEAQKYTIIRYFLRSFLIAAIVLIAYFTGYLNMVALFAGLFAIKVGAYLQPSVHRFLEWAMDRQYIKRKGGE